MDRTSPEIQLGVPVYDNEAPQIFQNMKFFLSSRVPFRGRYRSDIERSGGTVVQKEEDDDTITIVDHLRTKVATRSNTFSYEYIDQCIKEGRLTNSLVYRIRVPQASTSETPGVLSGIRRTKTPFTVEEDCWLWDHVHAAVKKGANQSGIKLYKQIAEIKPRHPAQSWRERYLKKLKDRPRPQALTGEQTITPPADEPEQETDVNHTDNEESAMVAASLGKGFTLGDGFRLFDHAPDLINMDPDLAEKAWEAWAAIPGNEQHTSAEWQWFWENVIKPKYLVLRQTSNEDDLVEEDSDQPEAPDTGMKRPRQSCNSNLDDEGMSDQIPEKRARTDDGESSNDQDETANAASASEAVSNPTTVDVAGTTVPITQNEEPSQLDDDEDDVLLDIDAILDGAPVASREPSLPAESNEEIPRTDSQEADSNEDIAVSTQEGHNTQNEHVSETERDEMAVPLDDLVNSAPDPDEDITESRDGDHSGFNEEQSQDKDENTQEAQILLTETADLAMNTNPVTQGSYPGKEDDVLESNLDDVPTLLDEAPEDEHQGDSTSDPADPDSNVAEDATEGQPDEIDPKLPLNTQAIFQEPLPEFDLNMPEPDLDDDGVTTPQQQDDEGPLSSAITTTTPGNTAPQVPASPAPDRHRHPSPSGESDITTTQPGQTPGVLVSSNRLETPKRSSPLRQDSEAENTGNDGLPGWVAEKLQEGYSEENIGDVLRASCLQLDVADAALKHLRARGRFPNHMRGLWTERDDQDLHSTDAKQVKRVQAKHGDQNLQTRLEFMSEENEDA